MDSKLSEAKITEQLGLWKSAFSKETSRATCALYDVQANLWGTLSKTKRDTPELIKDYFDTIFNFSNRSVEFHETQIRIFNEIAISSGTYTFSWVKGGGKVITKARYSFIYLNKDGQWLIVEHHSSTMPKIK